jgi:hypothetical protein
MAQLKPSTVLYALADRDSDTGSIYEPVYYTKRAGRDAALKKKVAELRADWTKTWGRRPSKEDMEDAAVAYFETWETTVAEATKPKNATIVIK